MPGHRARAAKRGDLGDREARLNPGGSAVHALDISIYYVSGNRNCQLNLPFL